MSTASSRTRPLAALAGAGLGFLLARGRGAVVGGFVALLLERLAQPRRRRAEGWPARAAKVLDLARAVAHAAGIDATGTLERYLERDAGLVPRDRETLRRRLAPDRPVPAIEEAAHAATPLPSADLVHALFLLHRVVHAERDAPPGAVDLVERAGRALGAPSRMLDEVRRLFVLPAEAEDPWAELDLAPGAPPDRVRERFRERARALHPDRFEHLGPEFVAAAETRFKRLKEARDRILEGRWTARALASVCPDCRTYSSVDAVRCPRCGAPKRTGPQAALRLLCPFCRFANTLAADELLRPARCSHCRVLLVR